MSEKRLTNEEVKARWAKAIFEFSENYKRPEVFTIPQESWELLLEELEKNDG